MRLHNEPEYLYRTISRNDPDLREAVQDWAQDEYVGVKYGDAHLNLLEGSEEVRWDELDAAVDAGEASLTTPR